MEPGLRSCSWPLAGPYPKVWNPSYPIKPRTGLAFFVIVAIDPGYCFYPLMWCSLVRALLCGSVPPLGVEIHLAIEMQVRVSKLPVFSETGNFQWRIWAPSVLMWHPVLPQAEVLRREQRICPTASLGTAIAQSSISSFFSKAAHCLFSTCQILHRLLFSFHQNLNSIQVN